MLEVAVNHQSHFYGLVIFSRGGKISSTALLCNLHAENYKQKQMATSPTFFLKPQAGVQHACCLNATPFGRWQKYCLACIYDRVITEICPVKRIFDVAMMGSAVLFLMFSSISIFSLVETNKGKNPNKLFNAPSFSLSLAGSEPYSKTHE